MQQADLILLVLDAHKGLEEEDLQLLEQVPQKKTIVVWNKMDLSHPSLPKLDVPYLVHLSAKEREGLDQLHAAIDAIIWSNGPPSKEEILITNIRHKKLWSNRSKPSDVFKRAYASMSLLNLTLDMRQSLGELGKIIGTNISEDILSAIFSKFCIGK